MGLFSNLIQTYDKCADAVGVPASSADGEVDEKKMLLPIFHGTLKTHFRIVLNEEGGLIYISRDAKEVTIAVPMSEASASRASGIAPHPLFDQLCYVDNALYPDKFGSYEKQLGKWKGNNKKLNAVYTFVCNSSIVAAMREYGCFKDGEVDANGNPCADKIEKLGVRFSVEIKSDNCTDLWKDKDIWDVWIDYQKQSGGFESGFDYITGKDINVINRMHPKNINSFTGNAKLLSCNDSSGFTFRGRFGKQDDAVLTDGISSQKAHLCLKWLIENAGYRTDSQVILIWAVDSDSKERILPYGNSYDLFESLPDEKSQSQFLAAAEAQIDKTYAENVKNTLLGLCSAERIKMHSRKIVIAIFDAATTGRMGVTFYQEMGEDEYLLNIAKWHEETSWYMLKSLADGGPITYIGCPSFNDILSAVYGKPRSGNDASYVTQKKKFIKMLIECMFGNFSFPVSMINTAAARVSQPLSFTNDKGSFNEWEWNKSLNTVCALYKKYSSQKEIISMELDVTRTDRDYLFGRLLSVANRLEIAANAKSGNNMDRPTNAIRLMCSFSTKPYSTWGVLWTQLNPYISQLNGAKYHISIVDEIMVLFKDGGYESNAPLSPLYLMGYSAQNRAFIKNKEINNENNGGNKNEQAQQ